VALVVLALVILCKLVPLKTMEVAAAGQVREPLRLAVQVAVEPEVARVLARLARLTQVVVAVVDISHHLQAAQAALES
jgi:hypothetical protein